MDPCPFCEIVALDDPGTREVYRDEFTVAFFPTEPAVLGHTLIIPRQHISDIWELDPSTAQHLASVGLIVALAIRRAIDPPGLNIIQSNGDAASQTVMHFHVHMVPRHSGDQIGQFWPRETNYSENAKDDAWDLIRSEASRL